MLFRTLNIFIIPIRGNKYYKTWRTPFLLRDWQNLARTDADVYDEWKKECSNKNSDEVATDISRLPKPLKSRMLHSREFIPISDIQESSIAYQRKAFGIFGFRSNIDPSVCWPTKSEIKLELEKERLFEKDMDSMLKENEAERKRFQEFVDNKMNEIDSNLAKMPAAINQYKKRIEDSKIQSAKLQEKREHLLDAARDHFGYEVSPKDPKFIKMKEELIQKEKILKKQAKKKR